MAKPKRTARQDIERAFHVSFKLPEQAAELLDRYATEVRNASPLDFATEFRIPCPDPDDPHRPAYAPVLRPEPLIIRKCTSFWSAQFPDGWLILNPNLQPGDHVWTGKDWTYRGELHQHVIYQWGRDQALAEAQRLAVEETARYEKWLADMRAGRRADQ